MLCALKKKVICFLVRLWWAMYLLENFGLPLNIIKKYTYKLVLLFFHLKKRQKSMHGKNKATSLNHILQ